MQTMEKRVPKSEKYSHVRGTLDTGLTVQKVKYVTASEYSKRREEIFFRITKHQLYELLNEYEGDEGETIQDARNQGLKIVSHSETAGPVYEKPYLILDVREVDYFNNYHILQARSFPYMLLRRDQMHPEIYRFRNQPETLIIVCCDDEKQSQESAKVLVDRGIDNVYLLTGGINEFAYQFPHFIEGIPPTPPASLLKGKKPPSSKQNPSLS
jgi:centrosomal protein CEP41